MRALEQDRMSSNTDANVWIDQYKKVGESVALWQVSARRLVCAANVLYCRERRSHRETLDPAIMPATTTIALMLYALALENLLKGLVVARGVEATSGGRLNDNLRHHRLRDLCREADVKILSDEVDLLKLLERLIRSGKYPFGVEPLQGKDRRGIMVPTDFERTFALIDRVEETLRQVAPDRTLETTDLRSLCVNEWGAV